MLSKTTSFHPDLIDKACNFTGHILINDHYVKVSCSKDIPNGRHDTCSLINIEGFRNNNFYFDKRGNLIESHASGRYGMTGQMSLECRVGDVLREIQFTQQNRLSKLQFLLKEEKPYARAELQDNGNIRFSVIKPPEEGCVGDVVHSLEYNPRNHKIDNFSISGDVRYEDTGETAEIWPVFKKIEDLVSVLSDPFYQKWFEKD